ncbi:zinc finger CCCH-type antiviral protein 1 isoform X2 [Phascolarctos cinereus]|uniref:Poly [ADP-ribose] polymerase n=1 Tax=Phascolarctos cinereus TaxID=38626 RepID=A0A6P5LAF3_PHACI|nr:zinc finger CCCH-type antiviral protein 1-like isoform X2 [Phascolarctos cinereus]
MADPAVCAFLTRLLCSHGGRMELRELLSFVELPEVQLLEVLREAGPDRFVLLDHEGDAGPTVLATTRVRVCRRVVCGGACEALHLCKLNLLDRCRRERDYCKYSHEIHSEKNIKILKKHDLSGLTKNELAVLLPQSDSFFLPDICKYYKGENRQDSCSKKTECMKLHICEHFLEGKCGFVHCNRSHNLMDTKVLEFLKEEGFTELVVRNIQDICNQKHAKSDKHISRRGRPNQKNVGSRSQSRNRYYFGRQELSPSPSPSASVGTARIPERDQTGPAPLPSSKGKVSESGVTKNSVALSRDCVQSVSASPKTASTQEVSQVGTDLGFPVTDHIEGHCGSQDGVQHAASISPLASADKRTTPAVSSHASRIVNVFFGSETDSFLSPSPVTTSKNGLMSSLSYTDAGDDCGSQKAYSSPPPKKTVDMQGIESSAVVFSKYKPTTNLKKEESSSKSTDSKLMLMNSKMTETAMWICNLEIPVANNIVANDSCSVRSGTSYNKQSQRRESAACKVDATTLSSEGMVRDEIEKPFHLPQFIQASPVSNTATARVRPKASSASDVSQGRIQKSVLAQSSSPTDHKTATSSQRKKDVHKQWLSDRQAGSVFTSGSSQSPGTLTTNKSRVVSPCKSTNAEDFKDRVSNATPSGMANNGSDKICLDYLSADCKLQSCCKFIHFHLPYRWQVCISDNWKDFKDMEDIERAYCDPGISKSHSIDFQKMLLDHYPVRRLCTPSSIQNPAHVLATKWHWYWKNELDQWIEYGKKEGSEFTSGDLEFFFLLCPEEFVEFSEGLHRYKVNFNEMIQTNVVSHTKREVRRRPEYVSSVTLYWTQKKENQHQEQSKRVSFSFPSHWDELNPPHTQYKLFEVRSTSFEYSNIRSRFKTTMKNFDIQKIMRNQNPSLWNDFQRKKRRMLNGGNEKILFHAADAFNMHIICNLNFDWSFQSLREAKYGKGIYFAKDACSSHNNHKSSAKNRIMFVAQVLVGAFVQGKMEYTHPPQNVTRCDSCVDNMTSPSTYVIFDKHQIYPEYIIEYTYIDKGCSIS